MLILPFFHLLLGRVEKAAFSFPGHCAVLAFFFHACLVSIPSCPREFLLRRHDLFQAHATIPVVHLSFLRERSDHLSRTPLDFPLSILLLSGCHTHTHTHTLFPSSLSLLAHSPCSPGIRCLSFVSTGPSTPSPSTIPSSPTPSHCRRLSLPPSPSPSPSLPLPLSQSSLPPSPSLNLTLSLNLLSIYSLSICSPSLPLPLSHHPLPHPLSRGWMGLFGGGPVVSINLSLNFRLVVRLRRTRSSSPSATCFATPSPCRSSSKHVRDAKE